MTPIRLWPRLIRSGAACAALVAAVLLTLSGCGFRGVNSLPLPGTAGGGPGSYTIQAELPDVANIEQNSRVRVGDVTGAPSEPVPWLDPAF